MSSCIKNKLTHKTIVLLLTSMNDLYKYSNSYNFFLPLDHNDLVNNNYVAIINYITTHNYFIKIGFVK